MVNYILYVFQKNLKAQQSLEYDPLMLMLQQFPLSKYGSEISLRGWAAVWALPMWMILSMVEMDPIWPQSLSNGNNWTRDRLIAIKEKLETFYKELLCV